MYYSALLAFVVDYFTFLFRVKKSGGKINSIHSCFTSVSAFLVKMLSSYSLTHSLTHFRSFTLLTVYHHHHHHHNVVYHRADHHRRRRRHSIVVVAVVDQ